MKLGPVQKRWVAYLKNNPERQHRGELGRIRDGKKMCCLGALGVIGKSCKWHDNILVENDSYVSNLLTTSFRQYGLSSEGGGAIYGTGNYAPSLAAINDDGENTWVDIAYIIEAVPEMFFTKSV